MTHWILIGLAILIAVLTVVAILDLLPPLRIVPDDTHFDFTRFRRISFPISAFLSIVAITLFFTHGLNFGIDFKGGTLLEIQAKSGTADIPGMRATLDGLGLGDVLDRRDFAREPIESGFVKLALAIGLLGLRIRTEQVADHFRDRDDVAGIDLRFVFLRAA